jgi:uncharacterized RDD family membrane protein YckC
MAATATAPHAPPLDPAGDLLGLRFEPERFAPGKWLPGRRRQRTTGGGRVDRGADFVEMLDDDAIEVGDEDLDGALTAGAGPVEDEGGPPFRIDDDLFFGPDPGAAGVPDTVSEAPNWADQGAFWPEEGAGLPGPALALSGDDSGAEAGGEPIIDRYDEVPERCWAPEVAGLGRRALALLVDQSFLMAILGVFFLGAFIALRLNGFDTGLFLGSAGLQASALPFALLAALLSLAYHVFFHGSTGCTPGKALVGIKVRTGDGGALSWRRAILRWLGAALGLACAGAGIVWAIFEPRRRGWADLISGTVIARPRGETDVEVSRR